MPMTQDQRDAMRSALDAYLDPAIALAISKVTTMFGARAEAQSVVDHMVDDAFRTELIRRQSEAADAAEGTTT